MKQYTIRHIDGTTKKVSEIELAKYGLKIPKAQDGMEVGQGTPQDQGQQQMEQIMGMVAQALQQGQSPEQVMQMLVQQGVPQEQAQQVIQQVMQQLQGEQQGAQEEQQEPMQEGMPQAQLGTEIGLNGSRNPMWEQQDPQYQKRNSFDSLSQNQVGELPINNYNSNNINTNPYTSEYIASKVQARDDNSDPFASQPTPEEIELAKNQRGPAQIFETLSLPKKELTSNFKNNVQFSSNGNVKPNTSNRDFGNYMSLFTPGYAGYVERGVNTREANLKLRDELKASGASLKDINRNIHGNNTVIAGGAIGQTMEDAKMVVGGVGKFLADSRATAYENANAINRMRNNDEIIKPFRGDSELGGGTQMPMSKYGGTILPADELDEFKHGGRKKRGHLKPNVMTERGEVINNTHTAYVDGGDNHSDPSGGNKKYLVGGSVVHSKSLGINVGDFLNMLQPERNMSRAKYGMRIMQNGGLVGEEPQAPEIDPQEVVEHTVATIAGKFKENKEVSYADLAKPFVKNLEVINKDIKKTEKKRLEANKFSGIPDIGVIANKTIKLNDKLTYKPKLEGLLKERELNMLATGPEGPLHNIAEGLKNQGNYGEDIKQESQDNKAVGAKNGKKIKLQLPMAQTGVIVDTPNNYSKLKTPYSDETGINRTNLRDLYGQYFQKDKEADDYYNQLSAQLSKGERTLNPIVENWNTYGQKRNPDGTYGNITDDQVLQLQNSPGFEFMTGIANKYGSEIFDPNDERMVTDFEKAANAADMAQGAIPHFSEKNQPFGPKKFGNWHASYNPWKNKSFGTPSVSYDPNMPIIYEQLGEDKKPITVEQSALKTKIPQATGIQDTPKRKRIYQEGLDPWQLAGPMMQFLTPRDPVPYIEDKGAKDALAANTKQRYTDIQPQLNRLRRGTLAQTRSAGTDPVSKAQQAQAYANEYENAAGIYGDKYNRDAAIEQRYNDSQNELRRAAGTNKANALNQLADRTATSRWKKTAMDINAVGSIADKFAKNRLENRTSALYQDMFPNVGYNGLTGYTTSNGQFIQIGGGGGTQPLTKDQIDYNKSLLDYELKKKEAQDRGIKITKNGGKIKLPTKSVKRFK